jgi:hypothetical protein
VESYAIEPIERGLGRATELVVMFVHTGWTPAPRTAAPFGGSGPAVGPTTVARALGVWPPEAEGAGCVLPTVATTDDRTTSDTTNSAVAARAGTRWGSDIGWIFDSTP